MGESNKRASWNKVGLRIRENMDTGGDQEKVLSTEKFGGWKTEVK